VLTGMATNICVLFTANDAYMRDYRLLVPCDCVASQSEDVNRNALEELARVLKADTSPSSQLSFAQQR
jgi:nicotinamidase-related amidase